MVIVLIFNGNCYLAYTHFRVAYTHFRVANPYLGLGLGF
jgi:hypothetical protein